MRPMTCYETFETLRQAGFTKSAIDQLYRLRRSYRTSELDQASLDRRRLGFIHWLVTTGQSSLDSLSLLLRRKEATGA